MATFPVMLKRSGRLDALIKGNLHPEVIATYDTESKTLTVDYEGVPGWNTMDSDEEVETAILDSVRDIPPGCSISVFPESVIYWYAEHPVFYIPGPDDDYSEIEVLDD